MQPQRQVSLASSATLSNHILASGRCDIGIMAVMTLGVGSAFGGNLRPSSSDSYLASSLWIWFRQKINKLGVREILNVFWLYQRAVSHVGSLQTDASERCLMVHNMLCLKKSNQPLSKVARGKPTKLAARFVCFPFGLSCSKDDTRALFH